MQKPWSAQLFVGSAGLVSGYMGVLCVLLIGVLFIYCSLCLDDLMRCLKICSNFCTLQDGVNDNKLEYWILTIVSCKAGDFQLLSSGDHIQDV